MNRKQSFLGKHKFYKLEQALELLTNMSDCEDESTSESKNEGDSSDSSEDAPEQHQVRTNSNILMPKETEISKAKEIPNKGQKAAPKPVDNQSSTKHALLADQTATTSGASPAKVSKVSKAKEIPNKGQKAAPNWWIIRVPQSMLYWLIKQPQHQVLHLQKYLKYLKPKKYPTRAKKLHQNWWIIRVPQSMLYWLIKQQHQVLSKAKEIPKPVDNLSATKAMASNSDIDVEDYYVIEDANESDSSKYVPCINYTNDKVYPEDVKNGWVRLEQDTGPPIFIGLRDPVITTLI